MAVHDVAARGFGSSAEDYERAGVLRRVEELAAGRPEPVAVPYETCVYWCRAQP